MEQIISNVVSLSLSCIIGLFLIDMACVTFLDASLIDALKNIFSKFMKKDEKDDNE